VGSNYREPVDGKYTHFAYRHSSSQTTPYILLAYAMVKVKN
jgi:hypothetical protein